MFWHPPHQIRCLTAETLIDKFLTGSFKTSRDTEPHFFITSPAYIHSTATRQPLKSILILAQMSKSQSTTSERLDVKRAAASAELSRSRKHQKTNNSLVVEEVLEPPEDQCPNPNYQRHGVFRFLNLPGELRNQIYAYAAKYAHGCFPPTYPKYATSKYTSRSNTLRGVGHTRIKRTVPSKPLPYLPLTQVCSKIRQEFRPMWLSTNRFPVFALEGYLKAFYPSTPRKPEAQARFEKSMNPTGTLRIYIGRDGIPPSDILRLIKFKLRFPDFDITPVPCPMFTDDITMEALNMLINNGNARWVQSIRSHRIKQLRVGLEYSQYAGSLHIVVGERWAEPCMKMGVPDGPALDEFQRIQKGLGLQSLPWKVTFGVDYA
ncbi:hypothetical protein J1614_008149 [Plenodomus biglobosus]|nr:hypothetical protein J1614_008149 [Plenodomus biglobosus]